MRSQSNQIKNAQNSIHGLTHQEPSQGNTKNLDMLNLLIRNSSIDHPQFNHQVSQEPPAFYRTQTHGNLFTGTIAQQPPRINTLRQVHPNSYAMQCLEYEKYLFDNRIKLIIKRMSIKAYNLLRNQKQCTFFTFPIQKLLITISKKLLLNRFELLFLQYVFEETKWRYNIDCIRKHASNFQSFILLSDAESNNPQIRYMQIYILYCAYYSKKSLNQLPSDNIFNQLFNQLCPKFKEEFPEWTQQSSMPNKINPKTLNNIFKKLTYNFDRDHEESENYSLIVEEILDISPAYNADKNGKQKKKSRKKKPTKEAIHIKPEQYSSQRDDPPLRFEEIIHEDHDILGDIPLHQKKSSFISNVDALEPRHYILRSGSNMQ